MSPVAAQLESVADRAFHSPWPPPAVPDVDLTSFALRDAPRLAGRPALIDAASGRTLRYGELAAGVARAAGGLARRGFERGDVLALHLPNLPEFALALHAGLRAGGVVTPTSPLYTVRELAGQLRNTRARMLITAGPLAAVGAEAAAQAGVEDLLVLGEAPGLTPFAELLASEDAPPEIELHPDDVALMLSSGGTTGLPKVVQLTHRALVANLRQMAGPYPIGEGEPVLGLAPFFHSMGSSACSTTRWQAAGRSSAWRAWNSRERSERSRPTASLTRSWRRRCWRCLPTIRWSTPLTSPLCARWAAAARPPAPRSSARSPTAWAASSARGMG